MFPGMPAALARVVETLSGLPGIGPKTALRLGLNLLERPSADVEQIALALDDLHKSVTFCDRCGCFAEQSRCAICDDARRDTGLICVVEQPVDVLMLERSGHFSGGYHVLHGRLSPVDGIGPGQLWLASLDARISAGGVRELVLATSVTVDGEATAHFIARRYRSRDVKISRSARGVPEGGEREYLDEHTLSRALEQRVAWQGQRGQGETGPDAAP